MAQARSRHPAHVCGGVCACVCVRGRLLHLTALPGRSRPEQKAGRHAGPLSHSLADLCSSRCNKGELYLLGAFSEEKDTQLALSHADSYTASASLDGLLSPRAATVTAATSLRQSSIAHAMQLLQFPRDIPSHVTEVGVSENMIMFANVFGESPCANAPRLHRCQARSTWLPRRAPVWWCLGATRRRRCSGTWGPRASIRSSQSGTRASAQCCSGPPAWPRAAPSRLSASTCPRAS